MGGARTVWGHLHAQIFPTFSPAQGLDSERVASMVSTTDLPFPKENLKVHGYMKPRDDTTER